MAILSTELAPSLTLAKSSNTALLQPEAAEALLNQLRQSRWKRLPAEYHDPLGMLFSNRAKQWTAGWNADQNTLYLLLWETESWEGKPFWSLYQNGQLVFQEADGLCKNRNALCQELLESTQLPFLSPDQLLAPLIDYRSVPLHRQQAGNAFAQTLLARPEVIDHLKETLLQALDAELTDPDWPVLDILKLHRVAHKATLLGVIDQCLKQGAFRTQGDKERLAQSCRHLEAALAVLQVQLSFLFQPALAQLQQALNPFLQPENWPFNPSARTPNAPMPRRSAPVYSIYQ